MRFGKKSTFRAFLFLGMSLILFGCGGGGSSAPATTPMAISGKVSLNGTGLAGVTVAISGAASSSLTTDSSGSYTLSDVQNGNYTLTPSISGYTFSPASQTITVANGNVTVPEFTATAVSTSFTVSGKVSLSGTGLPGATVTITGAGSGSTTTDAGGNYTFSGVHNGNCTITVSAAGFTFSPLSQAITVANANATVSEFTATTIISSTFTVSGKVSLNGTGLQGVTVSIAGTGFGSLVTDASGNYTFTGVRNGDYTLTPSLTGYAFTPASSAFSVNNGNVGGQDFAATPDNTGSIIITF